MSLLDSPGKSSWCLKSLDDCENCKYRACTCDCHKKEVECSSD